MGVTDPVVKTVDLCVQATAAPASEAADQQAVAPADSEPNVGKEEAIEAILVSSSLLLKHAPNYSMG